MPNLTARAVALLFLAAPVAAHADTSTEGPAAPQPFALHADAPRYPLTQAHRRMRFEATLAQRSRRFLASGIASTTLGAVGVGVLAFGIDQRNQSPLGLWPEPLEDGTLAITIGSVLAAGIPIGVPLTIEGARGLREHKLRQQQLTVTPAIDHDGASIGLSGSF